MELRYSAIVLKKQEVGETDRLYTLYTAEQGKVQLVAKGIRKSEAKLAGQLETLMQSKVIVVKGRGTGRIAGALAEKSFVRLRNDFDILTRVLRAVYMFERLVERDDADPELFRLLSTYLTLADELAGTEKKEKVFLLTEGFLFHLFARLGYEIETDVCVVSGKRLRADTPHYFSPGAGGVFAAGTGSRAGTFAVSENVIKLMRLFRNNRLASLAKIQATPADVRALQLITRSFFDWILS